MDHTRMRFDRADVLRACQAIVDATADPRYSHTSHLHVRVGDEVIVDEHLRGPLVADVFSLTKSVLSTVLGVMAAKRLLPPLDQPLVHVLPDLRGTPGAAHTWRQVLTMTRGAETGGPWDIDELTSLPGGQVARIAEAPQRRAPGEAFAYDNGGPHLLSAAACRILGESVSDFAQRELFSLVGIEEASWASDPDGTPFGYAHVRMRASDLSRLGQLWLNRGRWHDRPLMDAYYCTQMTSPQSSGGPPEDLPYGFLVWVGDGYTLAGGWAGQHVLVHPDASAVVVTTGDPRFDLGPPPSDELPRDWRPALDLVRRHLCPLLDRQS
jgi:CubicO group peptidase (beta-lactamase class C family)